MSIYCTKKLKYIVVQEELSEAIIVFDELISHKTVAGNQKVISAGHLYVAVDENGVATCRCFGDSFTLGIGSRPEKDKFMAQFMFNRDW